MNNNKVIYTAIFGDYDQLQEPKVKPEGFDFVCFTDSDIRSKNWKIRHTEREFTDPTRDARKHKVLAHEVLPEYDISVWVDGNLLVRGDVNKLIAKHLANTNMAVFDHKDAKHRDKNETEDSKDCLYEEVVHLIKSAERGRVRDDPKVMQEQVDRYRSEGYPEHNGLILSMVLLRRHHKLDVVRTMEAWWGEIKRGSKRDQLSFPYAAWKTGLKFNYIEENARNNDYFLHTPHKRHRGFLKKVWSRVSRTVS